eukprot:6211366-Pleurochrysis_carterae.AAC.1
MKIYNVSLEAFLSCVASYGRLFTQFGRPRAPILSGWNNHTTGRRLPSKLDAGKEAEAGQRRANSLSGSGSPARTRATSAVPEGVDVVSCE